MLTTVDSTKMMALANDDQLRVAIPRELKKIVQELSNESGFKNMSNWVKVAIIEKAERDIEKLQ